ncbi:tripartite tricarboxylate transporter TctB family protein [Paracoccus sp. Z330]|uniref:Tripartite tricarboxylate transporter TctB family protein n=1 Tax=Paracoccus onchidii TaxID=3017813 RepID=A0ABT4ZD33_9RHOB|nr:tripartite tricarboxylate transporter TctB family protein [Paracoccus onchidii]MDB6177261.1 tripartite tricarboxylate transporter TctB family protein [Paracoccus onchidii]
MKINKHLIALLVAIGGAALILSSYAYPALPGQSYGAGTMPFLIGVMGVLLGAALFVQAGRASWNGLIRFTLAAAGPQAWGAVATLVAVVAYILLANWTGFIAIATLLLFLLMLQGKVVWTMAAPLSVVASSLIYVVFSRFLLVPLPSGPIEALLWRSILH